MSTYGAWPQQVQRLPAEEHSTSSLALVVHPGEVRLARGQHEEAPAEVLWEEELLLQEALAGLAKVRTEMPWVRTEMLQV